MKDKRNYAVVESLAGCVTQVLTFTSKAKADKTFDRFAKLNVAIHLTRFNSLYNDHGYEVCVVETGKGD